MINFLGARSIKLMVAASFLGLLLGGVEIAFAGYIAYVLQILGITDSAPSFINFWPFNESSAVMALIFFLVFALLKSVLQAGKNFMAIYANELFVSRLKYICVNVLIYEHRLTVPASKINSYISDIFLKSSLVFHTLANTFPLIFQALLLLVFLMIISIKMSMIGLIYLFLGALLVYGIQKKIQFIVFPMAAINDRLHRSIKRILDNWFLVKVSRVEQDESRRFLNEIREYIHRVAVSNFLSQISEVIPFLMGALVIVGLLILQVNFNYIDSILFVSFLYIFLRFVQVLGQIANFLGVVNMNMPYFLSSYRFISNFSNEKITFYEKGLSGSNGVSSTFEVTHDFIKEEQPFIITEPPGIFVENLSFGYGENIHVLKNFQVSLGGGQKLVITGESGSGKSTLLSLMLGMLKPDSGNVKIGDLSPELFLEKAAEQIGYAGPNPFLFEGSIRENLLYGNRHNIPDDIIIECLTSLKLNDWLSKINFDLDYLVGMEKGALSTGEKQRISIARALLRSPKLLILDEVSANLDAVTEAKLVEHLDTLAGRVTIVIVTHRQGLKKYADQYIKMDSSINE